MSKKRKVPKGNVVWRQSADEATLAKKPHYNGFACGHGAHGSAKYDRTKAKRAFRKALRQEGASRGSFLYWKSGTLPNKKLSSCRRTNTTLGNRFAKC